MNPSLRQDRPTYSGNVIPAGHVQMVHNTSLNTLGCQTLVSEVGEPSVTLIKDGDVVRAIEITCTCGKVIRLDCEY